MEERNDHVSHGRDGTGRDGTRDSNIDVNYRVRHANLRKDPLIRVMSIRAWVMVLQMKEEVRKNEWVLEGRIHIHRDGGLILHIKE